jgi:hypothetical protein
MDFGEIELEKGWSGTKMRPLENELESEIELISG